MFFHARAVGIKLRVEEATNILDHDRARTYDAHEFDHRGEKIAFVVGAELLACVRKRRARNSPGNQINPAILVSVVSNPGNDVSFDDVPLRTILAKRVACVMIDLDDGEMIKSRLLQSKGLSSSTGTDLDRCQSHVPPSVAVPTG